MGNSNWNSSEWDSYKSNNANKSQAQTFTSRHLHVDLDPKNIIKRESVDSVKNPNSNAIIVALDVTGSMGVHAHNMAKEGLGVLMQGIIDRKPVADPHVMFMGVGDTYAHDTAPLQVTQFEADMKITDQLKNLYLEGGGGGNGFESYNLPWYFAAKYTETDCMKKRNKKGYLFTIGDEGAPRELLAQHIEKVFGPSKNPEEKYKTYSNEELLNMVSKMYNVYHVVLENGHYAASNLSEVKNSWQNLLGERVLMLSDASKLSEVIISAMLINEGTDAQKVIDSWDGSTALVISRAVGQLATTNGSSSTGVVKF